MKRLLGFAAISVCLCVTGASASLLCDLAVRSHQNISLNADGEWEYETEQSLTQRLSGPPQNDSPLRPVPKKPIRSPYHSDEELQRLREIAPAAPDGTLPPAE
jgi:hypothetical protein